ncbi:MAG: CoA transferase [Alphaproteobacteria bacterium]|nr:CoA transferase [Alphaproteobacteria bacterium]
MTTPAPLSGITVIDLSRILAGPYCTMVLAELGARVIKVETPEGDDARRIGPFMENRSAYFMSLNRGKESIALDLKRESDRDILHKLLEKADVVVENFRPGTMEKLELGWETLHARHPRLIYAAASGFGHSGPYSERAAYDMVVQAMGGIMSLTGHPGGAPTRVGTSIGDIAAGLFTATGINAALFQRESSGKGVKIDVAMLDCQLAILENAMARLAATGEVPGPLGARHPSITPFDAFATGDGHIVIAAGNDRLFERLCQALERMDLATNDLFADNHLRTSHAEALKDELESVLTTKPTAHWLALLEAAGVPCGPINNMAQVMADPQIAERNMVITCEDPVAGTVPMPGNPIKISGVADGASRAPAPELDQDREKILSEL